jgi:translation initiation factor IF-1
MMDREVMEVPGLVTDEHAGGLYAVEVTVGGSPRRVLARRCGRLFRNSIRVIVGDQVVVELCPYDLTRGRILQRERNRGAA